MSKCPPTQRYNFDWRAPQLLDTRPVDGEPDWLEARQVWCPRPIGWMLLLLIFLLRGVDSVDTLCLRVGAGARRIRVGAHTARPRQGQAEQC